LCGSGIKIVVQAVLIERESEQLDLRARRRDLRVTDVPKHHRPHEPCQDRDHGDHDQELDEREASSAR